MDALLYVCSRLKELALLSHSQLVAGIVLVAQGCSLPLSIFLFSPTHNALHKKTNFASPGVHALVQI